MTPAHAAPLPGTRRLVGGAAILLTLGAVGPTAHAEGEDDGPPERPFEITQEILAASVSEYTPKVSEYTPGVREYDPSTAVTALGSAGPDDDSLIVLETDILFAPNAWELPDGAGERIAALAEEIPENATVQVGGHTDSRPVDASKHDFDNQQLSENRARAVADALAAERPDLTLEVTGHGSEQPAESEDPEDPSTYAANRRVELRYEETE